MKTEELFTLLAATYVAQQQYIQHSVSFPWQRFQYLHHFWQRRMYLNSAKRKHFFVLRFHDNSGYPHTPQCYIVRILPLLFLILLRQCFPNFFARGPLLASKNKHGSSHPCSRKCKMSG